MTLKTYRSRMIHLAAVDDGHKHPVNDFAMSEALLADDDAPACLSISEL